MTIGKIARACAVLVICAQMITFVAVVAVIPSSQTIARASEVPLTLEASDLPNNEEADAAAHASMEGRYTVAPKKEAIALPEGVLDEVGLAEDGVPAEVGGSWQASPDCGVAEGGSFESSSCEEPCVEQFASVCSERLSGVWYSSDELRSAGLLCDGERQYTWYSQQVLPGGGLDIEGRHVTADGYVADSQGRIVVASSDLPKGTEIDVPFGDGKAVVLDTGCAAGIIDVYTDF